MARDGRLWLFLVVCVYFGVGVLYCVEIKEENAETGKSHTFKPNIKDRITTITWKFEKNPDNVIKLVDWDPQNNVYWYSQEAKARASLNIENGELTINNLMKGDNGVYDGEFEVAGLLKNFKYKLTVMDGVPKPQVTCELKNKTIELVCSLNPPVKAEITWGGPDGVTTGEIISIPEGQSKDSVYFCTATNEVSKQSTEWKLTKCSEGSTGGSGSSLSPGIIIGVIVGVSVLIAGAVFGAWKLGKLPINRAKANPGAEPELKSMIKETETNPTPNSNGGTEAADQAGNSVKIEVLSPQDNEVQEN